VELILEANERYWRKVPSIKSIITGGYCVPQLTLPYWQVLRTANGARQTGGG
jgi:hypothetical protein